MPPEDSKPVKKEEVEDDDDERSLGALLRDKGKKKPVSTSNAASKLPKPSKEENADFDAPQKKPTPKAVKPKKEESPAFDSADDKSRLKKSAAKDDKSKIKKKEEVKDKKNGGKNEGEAKKKERKVYDLPGQKRDPPEERDPLRIFYESLYEQVPDSDMAAIWMMESGLLPKDAAKQVFERKQKKSQMQKLGSPMKPSSVSAAKRASQPSTAVKKAKDSSSSASAKKTTTTTTTTKAATATKTKKRKKDESSEEEDEDGDEDSEDDFDISKMVKKQRTT